MQRASKQCVVWGNSWARILGARVVVGGGAPKCLLPRRVRGARTTVLGLVERVVTVGLGFGEKVTAGARRKLSPTHNAQCGATRLDRGCITDQGDERLGSWNHRDRPGSTIIVGINSTIIGAVLVKRSL